MADIGKRNLLPVLRAAPPGLYLDGGNHGEILLPNRDVPDSSYPGAGLDVFVYRDSEDRLVATTAHPKVMVGEFAGLDVVASDRRIGAFLDWGLPKDLLLPNREQETPVYAGDRVVVFVFLDTKSDRLVATTRLDKNLDLAEPEYAPGQEVSLLVVARTPLGYKTIVNGSHWGLLYASELGAPLEPGARMPGFIKLVRPDGKIDLRLDPSGYQRVKPLGTLIMDALDAAGGRLPFHDDSPPELIREAFQSSKKAFKQALGALYRQRKIRFTSGGIEKIENPGA